MALPHSVSQSSNIQTENPATNLIRDFDSLISQCLASLKSQCISQQALVNSMLCLKLFDPADSEESLVVDCKNDLQKASESESFNAAIFEIVKPYMSFLNPELLAHIIEFLGSDDDRKNYKDYMKALEEYCKVTQVVLACPSDEMPESEMAFQPVHVAMETPTMNLKSVRNIKSNLAKILKLNAAALQIKTIGPGVSPLACFFQLPNFACEKVFPLSNEQEQKLRAIQVISLKCGEYSYESFAAQSDQPVSCEDELEIPCLGRPFRLGMFYNCRNDNLLLGIRLCNDDVIDTKTEEIPQVSHSCEVLEDDSLETKASSLQLNTPLKLSLMSNLVQNISKSAKYWNDRCKSKRQVRVCLKYTNTTDKKHLPLEKLGEIQHHVFEGATHVVTGALYGLDAYCVFDHTLRENERFEDVHKNMLTMVKALSSSDTPYSSYSQTDCKVFSDTEQPCTLQETVEIFRKLPSQSASEKPSPVPKKVWLYPLKKLDNRYNVIAKTVSTDLSDQVQSTLECLRDVETLANDLLNQHSIAFSIFQHTENRVAKFTEIVTTYRGDLRKQIAKSLPRVREGTADEGELTKVVEESSSSPFKYEFLITWLEQVKEEISTLEMLVNEIKDVEFISSRELQTVTEELDSDYLVCFAFHVALEDDPAISYLQSYLETKEVDKCLSETQMSGRWYTNTELMKKITSNIERLKTFSESNSKNKNTKFTLTSCTPATDVTQSEPSSILLYEGTTCKVWEPPGVPGKPTEKASEVKHDTVQLEWTKPEYGSQSVECYQVSYHPVDNPQGGSVLTTNSAQETTTVSGLEAGTKYVFVVQSKCKVGVGAKGEASDPIETKTALPALNGAKDTSPERVTLCQSTSLDSGRQNLSTSNASAESANSHLGFTKPRAITITHNSITLEWPLPAHNSDEVDSYTISYRKVDATSAEKWKKQFTNCSERQGLVSSLSPQTKYIFKVRPELEDDEVGVWSEISDPIETKEHITHAASFSEGKPTATRVTHDSITLQWNTPERSRVENVESYMVRYRSLSDDSSKKWEKKMIDSSKGDITVTGLTPKTKYIFKIRPELEDGVGAESEVSEAIETKNCLSRFDKPTTLAVTHDSVQLKLTKLEHGTEDTERCAVCYRLAGNTGDWNYQTFDNVREHVTIDGLNQNTEYIFKIFSKDGSEEGPESETSEPIRTNATSPPGKPIVTAVTHNSITVRWAKPEHGVENIKSYSVHFAPRNDKLEEKKINARKEDFEATITSLASLETYTITVQPICKTGGVGTRSEPSDPIQTKATSPPGQPVKTKVTHDSVSLKWDPPSYSCENIDHYSIQYRACNLPDKWDSKKAYSTKLTIPALNCNTEYIFKVHPVCKNGEGSESELSDPIKTNPASPPSKPTATGVTHNSITLSWNKPEYGSENGTNYLILIRKRNSEEWTVRNTSSTKSTNLEIKNLDPATEYLFKVKLVCHTGVSDESEMSDPITSKPVCQPGKPYPSKLTRNSVVLTWEVPKHYHSSVTQYTILPVSQDTKVTSDWARISKAHSKPCKTESYYVGNLTPGQNYMFKVVPSGSDEHCIYTESEPSEEIVTKITSSPGTPEISDVTNDTAVVKWTHPDHGKDNILHYTVCYRSATDPTSDWKHQNTSGRQTSQVITGLSMKTKYKFMVIPKCIDEMEGTESETGDPIETAATSPPGVPEATDVTHEKITLEWTPPDIGGENVKSYCVYHRQLEHEEWKRQTTADTNTHIIIGGLDTNKYYKFKVKAITKPGCGNSGAESKVSEPVLTSKCCSTGMPRATVVTHNSIELEWDKPHYGYQYITCYEVTYRIGRISITWYTERTEDRQESIVITGLSHNTEHLFKVRPVCEGTDIHAPYCITGYIKTEDKPLAERMLDMCSKSDSIVPASKTNIKVNRIPNRRQDMKNDVKQIAKYHYGTPVPGTPERVIMLVGATGAGKSSLINSIASYILGVSWETPFRFKLIEDEKASQAHSQTSWITAYTFHAQKGSPIKYDITIVDTPGFGDTRGIERDKEITAHIKEFFSVKPPNGIEAIHAIGFVAQAPLARLTPTQKYVFDSILAMFGKDIADNIFLMATFADGQPPQVLAAIKEANVKCKKCFKFNNSVLYANTSTGGEFGQLFWEMNAGSIKGFFKILETTPAISLKLTKEVLQKREHLEALIQGLKEKIQMGLNIIQEMQQEEKIMKDHMTSVFDPNFEYEVDVPKTRPVKLSEGTYVTNCKICEFTCHFPCTISENGKKYSCAAMGGWWLFRDQSSTCQVCPGKCHWTEHEQNDYRLEIYTEKEKRTLKDLMERYLESPESEDSDNTEAVADKMLSSAREKLKALNKDVLDLIKQTQKCVKRLQEIAYKPHPLDEAAYIDLMIESEKREGKDGFAGRVSALEELKEQARLLSTLGHDDEGADSEDPKTAQTKWWSKAACSVGKKLKGH